MATFMLERQSSCIFLPLRVMSDRRNPWLDALMLIRSTPDGGEAKIRVQDVQN